EALVFAANGMVTAEAKAAFERAVALDANAVQARYFLGLAAEQDGDRAQAAATWRALIEAAPPDAPWVDLLRRALARVDRPAAPCRARRPRGCSEWRSKRRTGGCVFGARSRATPGHDSRHGRAAFRAAASRRRRCGGMAATRSLLYGARPTRQGARRRRRCAPCALRRHRQIAAARRSPPRTLPRKLSAGRPRHDPQATTPLPHRCRARRDRARGGFGARRAQGVHRLLQFADRRGRKTNQTGDAYPRRRPREAGQRLARRKPCPPFRGDRRQAYNSG